MSYKVNRALGYQKWGVTNPFVFADLSQPQRRRTFVSPVVFQTQPPSLLSAHLGQSDASPELRLAELELKRAERMERIAIAGFIVSLASLALAWRQFSGAGGPVTANRRRRARRSHGRRSSR